MNLVTILVTFFLLFEITTHFKVFLDVFSQMSLMKVLNFKLEYFTRFFVKGKKFLNKKSRDEMFSKYDLNTSELESLVRKDYINQVFTRLTKRIRENHLLMWKIIFMPLVVYTTSAWIFVFFRDKFFKI